MPTDEGGRRGWATSVLSLAGICSAPQVSWDPLRSAPSAPGHTGETEAPEVRPLAPGHSAAARRLQRAAWPAPQDVHSENAGPTLTRLELKQISGSCEFWGSRHAGPWTRQGSQGKKEPGLRVPLLCSPSWRVPASVLRLVGVRGTDPSVPGPSREQGTQGRRGPWRGVPALGTH